MEKIETRGRKRNPHFVKECAYIRGQAESVIRCGGELMLLRNALRDMKVYKAFRQSAGFLQLKQELQEKGIKISLFKRAGVLVVLKKAGGE